MQINDGKLKFRKQNQINFQLVKVYIMSDISSQVKDFKMNRTGNTEKYTQISSKGKSVEDERRRREAQRRTDEASHYCRERERERERESFTV